jgi:hypothetical protein
VDEMGLARLREADAMVVQAMCASLFVLVAVLGGLRFANEYLEFALPRPPSDYAESDSAFQRSLEGNIPNSDAAALLLDRVDKVTAEYASSTAALDAKANTILGFLGAGIGILAVLQGGGSSTPVVPTPLLVTGFALTLAALGLALAALWVRPSVTVNLENFSKASFLKDTNAKALLAARVAHSYLRYQRERLRPLFLKTAAVKGAQLMFALGAAALAANVLFPIPKDKAKARETKCVVQKSLTVDCNQDAE